jgi:hypothetical protein
MIRPARRPSFDRVRPRFGRVLPLVVVGIVVAGLGLGVGWWWLANGRLPLAGTTSHDFGLVRIEGDDIILSHEFVLTNRRSEPVRIVAARPSCGCAGVDYEDAAIAPGASVTITGRLALELSGPRSASVALILDNDETQRLFMEAVARKERTVRVEPSQLTLRAEGESQVLVQARILREVGGTPVEPPVPTLEVPAGVTAEWRGWTMMSEGDPETMRADGWRGRIVLTPDGEEIGFGATLVITLPGASEDGGDIRATCRIAGVEGGAPAPGPVPGGGGGLDFGAGGG